MLSVQFDELLWPPNHEPFELDGIHDDEPELIEGNHEDDDEEWSGFQLDDDDEWSGFQLDELHELDDDGISADPSTTPTPSPMPNTASTVESG
jgi:hypothetical protein